MIIRYQESEQFGLTADGHELHLRHRGETVGRTSFAGSAEEAINSLVALELFPEQEFSFTGELIEQSVTLTVEPIIDSTAFGRIKVGDMIGFWSGQHKGNNVFLTKVPGREYATDRRGFGWEITLPKFVFELDPVIVRRIALGAEELIYRLAFGQIDAPVLNRKINNVFSAQAPIWKEPLPPVKAVRG
jgi:hypothetical protein